MTGRVEAVFGYPPDSWRTLPGFWVGVLHPEDRHRVANAVHRALRDRQPCEIEYRALASDGAVVRVRDQVRVIADRDGSPRSIQGRMVVHDRPRPQPPEPLPHVRRSRRAGPRSTIWVRREPAPPRLPVEVAAPVSLPPIEPVAPPEEPARPEPPAPAPEPGPPEPARVFAAVGQAVITSDEMHRITSWNAGAEQLLGWSAAEAVGRLDSELVPARTDARQNAEVLSALVRGRPWSAEVEVTARDGTPVPVLISAGGITRPDGARAGFVAVITDLRGVRRAAALEMRESIADAVAAIGRAAGRELDGIATRIDELAEAALEQLGDHPRDRGVRASLASIRRAADQAGSLAHELRDAGRDRDVSVRPIDLADLVRQNEPALDLLAPASVHVSFRTEPAPPAWLDPVAVSQALFHFAADACSAMPDGGRIEIAVFPVDVFARQAAGGEAPAGHYVALEIRDTRPGFEPADLHRWFDPASGPGRHPLRRSAAHGLVHECGAFVAVNPAEDRNGLVLRVYFRAVRPDNPPAGAHAHDAVHD